MREIRKYQKVIALRADSPHAARVTEHRAAYPQASISTPCARDCAGLLALRPRGRGNPLPVHRPPGPSGWALCALRFARLVILALLCLCAAWLWLGSCGSLSRELIRGHQPLRHSCEASHDHAKGSPTREKNQGRENVVALRAEWNKKKFPCVLFAREAGINLIQFNLATRR